MTLSFFVNKVVLYLQSQRFCRELFAQLFIGYLTNGKYDNCEVWRSVAYAQSVYTVVHTLRPDVH